MRINLAAIALLATAAWCQTPVVSSFVNSASYQPTLGTEGTIATIFGTNMATSTATAEGLPLQTTLAGTSVTYGGVAAPLFYVSPTQINLQVPSGASDLTILVTSPAGTSAPYDLETATPQAWGAGGIFTSDASGCGQGAVLNIASDGGLSLNSTANSISPGNAIAVYGTGLAKYYPIGVPAPPPAPPYYTGVPVYVDADVMISLWTGLAPGFVGLDQTNLQIPETTREGCAVPLRAEYQFNSVGATQPVTISVRKGGGPCVDPPTAGYGQIVWRKIINTPASGPSVESDSVTASLQASPGKQAPLAPTGPPTPDHLQWYFGPSCPVPGYRSLAAGTVTAQGPGMAPTNVPVTAFAEPSPGNLVYEVNPLEPAQIADLSLYQLTLPSGTIQPGNVALAAGGGTDVGPFQASVDIGQDIQIQTPLAGARVCGFTINWTGGDPLSWVTASVVVQSITTPLHGAISAVSFYSQARTSAGTLTMTPGEGTCIGGPLPIQIAVEVDPDPSEITTFSASGLSLGGQATWKYIHTFEAAFGPQN